MADNYTDRPCPSCGEIFSPIRLDYEHDEYTRECSNCESLAYRCLTCNKPVRRAERNDTGHWKDENRQDPSFHKCQFCAFVEYPFIKMDRHEYYTDLVHWGFMDEFLKHKAIKQTRFAKDKFCVACREPFRTPTYVLTRWRRYCPECMQYLLFVYSQYVRYHTSLIARQANTIMT